MDDFKPTKEINVNLEQKEDRTVSIMVKDNGLGINKENLPFIFERFSGPTKPEAKPEGAV